MSDRKPLMPKATAVWLVANTEEIERAEKDPDHELRLSELKVDVAQISTAKRSPRYTPLSRRHERPNAVLWLLRNHPELKDSQLMRLVGTTKTTIGQVRDRSHWNSPNLVPQDPVTLGLCSQIDLDAEVKKAARRVERERKENERELVKGGTLLPAEETTEAPQRPIAEIVSAKEEAPREVSESEEAARVFAKLKQMKSAETTTAEDE